MPLKIPQPPNTHIAQLNVGRAVDDMASARLAPFMTALDQVNALADRAPGFIWRLQSDSGNATDIQVSADPRFLVNLSVWATPAELSHFVWNTLHKRFVGRRADWFEPMSTPHVAFWWVPIGHIPTTEEAMARLAQLTQHGPSKVAFGWPELGVKPPTA